MPYTIQVCIGSVMPDEVNVENVTPKGSVNSLILFLFAIKYLSLNGVKVSMLSDDTSIWKTERDILKLNAMIQDAMNSIHQRCVKS